MSTKFVILFVACFLSCSNRRLLLQSQAAARLLAENPPGGLHAHFSIPGDGRGKTTVEGSKPRKDKSWEGGTSPSGKILTPPPSSTTKFAYKSSNATSNSPGSSSSANSTALVRTVTPTGRPSPSVTIAMAPSIVTPGYAHASSSVTVRRPGSGSPGNANP